jgi:hypothetical protein
LLFFFLTAIARGEGVSDKSKCQCKIHRFYVVHIFKINRKTIMKKIATVVIQMAIPIHAWNGNFIP